MHKYLILIAILIHLGIGSYAQEKINLPKILNIEQNMPDLENRIRYLVKNKPEIAHIQGLKIFYIYPIHLEDQTLKKKDFLDSSFLYKPTSTGYYSIGSNRLFKKEKKYLRNEVLITDSTGNLLATGDARLITLFRKDSYIGALDMKIANMLFNNEIDFAFYLECPYPSSYTIGIKGNELYTFNDTKEGLKIYTWKEFIECYFDKSVLQQNRSE